MFTADDHRWMAHALRLAEKGLYSTHPNPRVGCVLVRDGEVVGEAWHERAGEPHAEVLALRAAGERARGATAYVTLEPCAHQGRTPPCTEALISAGVARVIAATRDADPRSAGKGLEALRAAGIATALGLLEAEARRMNAGFFSRLERGRPRVTIKQAMSLDGRTALASGASRWISGEAARRDVQYLRARHHAVLTGSGTVLADDPRLNLRLEGAWRQPLRVVLDSRPRMPEQARMLSQPGETWVFTAGEDAPAMARLRARGARLELVGKRDGALDLEAVFARLAALEINDVLVEAGPTLGGALLAAGLVDELVIYLAPHLLGHRARPLFELPEIALMSQRVPLRITDIRAVGEDWKIVAVPRSGGKLGAGS